MWMTLEASLVNAALDLKACTARLRRMSVPASPAGTVPSARTMSTALSVNASQALMESFVTTTSLNVPRGGAHQFCNAFSKNYKIGKLQLEFFFSGSCL